MKKIEAIIRSSRLEAVKEALGKYNIHGLTVTHVLGCGLQRGQTEYYRGNLYTVNLLPKVKVEIIALDHRVPEIVEIISREARTGEIGDGKIFIYPVETAIRIRTGEQGDDAI
ncbi:P-II family nitrogen regulator [Neomoorella thermoacetica]|uniref:Nitrogen regulatory protein P-II n=1 Tax=Neomoorella thermoacetica TaxID=1525 RepID=A0A1D7XAU6_NEOTH|nr:P-II family nitrogen regulator [Moorella thermoacetica]AOQ24029.1 Nitrogen regulatory protein P-II [Moorella thermoacetica]OIQ09226.1 nitrogen regulatory protein P-II [Moorella thermoacetica]OIQ12981.1 nitrogen regulatory protein P-II [Moorella thermoacetica]OIQ56445.1 nitrogen regulatory protein P-II [Moorella thermoacetica]TYL14433.1 Nitrogen regulatory protein P-II [Moorella thermoacetica]